MDTIYTIMQALADIPPQFALSVTGTGILINYISKSLMSAKNRKQNKIRNFKLYKHTGNIDELQKQKNINSELIKLIFKGNNKQDYRNFINTIKIPDELKDIVNTFVQNVDKENLKSCAENLKSVKINKKNFLKDFKQYINNFISPLTTAGLYNPYTNTIDLFIPSKQVLSHEFIHMCSASGNDNCGFHIYTRFNAEMGRGLNEGYTELLNSRIFKYPITSYGKNVNLVKLLETFFDNPKDLEKAFFHSDIDTVLFQFCKYGTKEEFFDLLNNLDNLAMGSIPINDFIKYHKLQFKLYEIIKRSQDKNKIQNFENILFQNPLNNILHKSYTLTSLNMSAKKLK